MLKKTFWFPIILMYLIAIFWAFASAINAEITQEPSVKAVEPESNFQKAHGFFLKKDFKAAATEIQKGAEILKKEAVNATEEGKEALTDSMNELEKLAKDVEKGAVTSEKKLKDAFVRANYALANHQYLKASESWAKKEAKRTGHALKAATQHLEQAAKWSGHKLETDTVEVIKGTRKVAGKLIQGIGGVPEEVGKDIKDIGNEISKLGKKIKPEEK